MHNKDSYSNDNRAWISQIKVTTVARSEDSWRDRVRVRKKTDFRLKDGIMQDYRQVGKIPHISACNWVRA